MKTIQIKAKDFFELLKERDTSMWEVFSQMVDGERKAILFLDENDAELFSYALPETLEQIKEDQKIFAKQYAQKMSGLN